MRDRALFIESFFPMISEAENVLQTFRTNDSHGHLLKSLTPPVH